jgi:redox-sensitive bicupin YhaK (pirin superfamily)
MTSNVTLQRSVVRTVTTPAPAPGFAGPGHTAVFAVDPNEFALQDPFIMMADDRLDLPEGATVGGEHPHAGFEIATFLLEGAAYDQDEGPLNAGDLQWMVAGSGVIHGEHVTAAPRTRLLQLWYALPEEERWKAPSFATIEREQAELRREPGVEVRRYHAGSGFARNSDPPVARLIVSEARLDAGSRASLELPADFNAFLYVIEGQVRAGEGEGTALGKGQIGWLDRSGPSGGSSLSLVAGESGARVVLYAGEPQNVSIAMHGPFVGGSRADLMKMSRDWMDGRFQRMSALVRAAKAGGRR